MWEEVRRGAAHFHERSAVLPVNRLGQFVHGLCLPLNLARIFLEDREKRRRYLRVTLTQMVAVLALAVLFTGSGQEVVENVVPEDWSEQQEEVDVRVEEAQAEAEERWRAARETERPRKRTAHRVVYWAALLSSLQLAQWIVVALSRDYHTEFSRQVSLCVGLTPEDEPLEPRVRLNTHWLRTKLKRRLRGMVVFAAGVPILWALKVLLPGGGFLFPVVLSAWGAWWFVVFTAGKSSLAWSDPAPPEPWFLRGWKWFTAHFAPLGIYGSLWTKLTHTVFAPAASVERQPWSLSGLAVARAFAVLPLVKCFLRPFIPVAASHLLVSASPRPSALESEAALSS